MGRNATFSFDRSDGFVTFNTTMTSGAEVVADELQRLTAFIATERPDARG